VSATEIRAYAIAATALALALVNVGLAALIALAVGPQTLMPTWLALAVLVVGLATTAGAVALWRTYLSQGRQR
jgi:hypothetical protein